MRRWGGATRRVRRGHSGEEGRGYEARRGREEKAPEPHLIPSNASGRPAPPEVPSAPAPVCQPGGAAAAGGRGGVVKPHRACRRGRLRARVLLGSVGLPGVGSNLLVLVIYLKLPRLCSPARLLLLRVSLGDLLPSVLQAALAFPEGQQGWGSPRSASGTASGLQQQQPVR